MTFPIVNNHTPDSPLILKWFASAILKLGGWKLGGELPDTKKFIIAGGPHTTNQDGFMMALAMWSLRLKLSWIGKKELFKGPFSWLLKKVGGVPIDRQRSANVVQQVADQFKASERMVLVISPEGTRKKTDHWKTGFYWMAYDGEVPIMPARINYVNKTIELGPPFHPSGDIENEMQVIWDYLGKGVGKNPELMSDMRLRPSALKRKE